MHKLKSDVAVSLGHRLPFVCTVVASTGLLQYCGLAERANNLYMLSRTDTLGIPRPLIPRPCRDDLLVCSRPHYITTRPRGTPPPQNLGRSTYRAYLQLASRSSQGQFCWNKVRVAPTNLFFRKTSLRCEPRRVKINSVVH